MEKKKEKVIELVPLLVKFARGNTSEEESVKARKALKRDTELKNDFYFIVDALYGIYDEELCPSTPLITYYAQHADELIEEVEQALKNHIDACTDCAQKLEDFQEFSTEADRIVENKLSNLAESSSKTITDILKQLAEDYLNADIAEGLFKEIENIDVTSGEGALEGGLALSGDASSELTSEEREFLGIVENVMPEKEEINDLLEKGNEEKVREKLLEIMEDEKKVEELIDVYKDSLNS